MPNSQSGEDLDPVGNYHFALEILQSGSREMVAHFMECSGLKSSTQVFEIEEGGLNNRTHKRVGQSKWENLVIRYATSDSTFMMQWRDRFLMDEFGERLKYSGSIAVMNNKGDVIRRYSFQNAWPVSWEGPTFSSGGSALAVETLEIAHDGLTVSFGDDE